MCNQCWMMNCYEHEANTNLSCASLNESASKSLVAYGDVNGKTTLFAFESGFPEFTLPPLTSAVRSLHFFCSTLIGGDQKGSVHMWDAQQGKCVHTFERLHSGAVTSLDAHCAGNYFASASEDKVVRIWDFRSKSCAQSYKNADAPLNAVVFAPHTNEKSIVTGSADGMLRIYNLATTKMESSMKFEGGPITCVQFYSEKKMIIGNSAGVVAVCETKPLRVLFESNLLRSSVDCIACNGKNAFIAARNKLTVIDLESIATNSIIKKYATTWGSFAAITSYGHDEIRAVQIEGSKGSACKFTTDALVEGNPSVRKDGSIVYRAEEKSPLGITEVIEDGEEVVLTLKSRLERIRQIRQAWQCDPAAAVKRVRQIAVSECDTSLLCDLLMGIQKSCSTPGKVSLNEIPCVLKLVEYTFEAEETELTLLGLDVARQMVVEFESKFPQCVRRGIGNDPAKRYSIVRAAFTECANGVVSLVARGDAVGANARLLIQQMPT